MTSDHETQNGGGPDESQALPLKSRLLAVVKDQSERYGWKLAWRLYKAFYDDEATLAILRRANTIQGALRAVSRELHRSERIWRDGYRQALEDAGKPPEPEAPRPKYKHQ